MESFENAFETCDLVNWVTEERSLSEKFKSNFLSLKAEYEKLCRENKQLQEDIIFLRNEKEKPYKDLKLALQTTEEELKAKDIRISVLEDKLRTKDELLQEKDYAENQYSSRIAASELALEQTKSMLSRLHCDTSLLINGFEDAFRKNDAEHQKIILELSGKCNQSDKEKREIAQEILSATNSASKRIDYLKKDNALLTVTIEKLKDALENLTSEKSQMSLDIETLKSNFGKEKREMLSQLKAMETKMIKLQSKSEALETNLHQALQERNECETHLSVSRNENSLLRQQLLEVQIKLDKTTSQMTKRLEEAMNKFDEERMGLVESNNNVKQELSIEKSKLIDLIKKLQIHESELNHYQGKLQRKEIETAKEIHIAQIKIEEKYKAILESKLHRELELTGKLSEMESHLILTRNLNVNLESQLEKVSKENSNLSDQLRSMSDLPAEKRIVEKELEVNRNECLQLREELNHFKQLADERFEMLQREREGSLKLQMELEEKLFQGKYELQEKYQQLQNKFSTAEKESHNKINKLQLLLRETQMKSQQYAKLIWKLRHRLFEVKNVNLAANSEISQVSHCLPKEN